MYAEQQSNNASYAIDAPGPDRPIVPRLTDAMHTVNRMLDQLRELERRIMGAKPELAGQVGPSVPEPMLSLDELSSRIFERATRCEDRLAKILNTL